MVTGNTGPIAAAPTRGMVRRWPWRICIVLAAVLLFVGNLGLWAYRTTSDQTVFVDSTQKVFDREDVRNAVATKIVDRMLRDSPRILQGFRDTLVPIVAGMLKSAPFKGVLAEIVIQLHRAIVTGEPINVTISSPELQQMVVSVLQVISPADAATLAQDDATITFELFAHTDLPSYQRELQTLRWTGIIGGVAGLLLLALPLVVRRDRWSVWLAGLALIGVFVATALFVLIAGRVIDLQIIDLPTRTMVSGVADELFERLISQSLIVLAIGVVLCVVGLVRWPGGRAGQPAAAA